MIIEANGTKEKLVIEADARATAAQREGEGQKQNATLVGEGEAAKTKAIKVAEAEGTKAILLANAEGEQAKLIASAEGEKAKLLAQAAGKTADAEATSKLAEAMKALDERGTLILILRALPELIDKGGDAGSKIMESIFKSAAAPFGSIDKITITDLGGNGQALSKYGAVVPNFVMDMLKKFSAAGIDVKELAKKVGINIDDFAGLMGKETSGETSSEEKSKTTEESK